MNDVCFTNVTIKNITEQGKYKILSCTTQIPTEQKGFINAIVFVYIDEVLFSEKNENKRTKDMLAIEKSICVTGKTVHEIKNSQIAFRVLVQNSRRIEMARNKCEVNIKLFDIYIETLVHQRNLLTNREEVLCKYFNSDDKNTPSRDIIVSVPIAKVPILKENTSFNISGSFVIRQTANKLYPVIITRTFVKDTKLDTNIYIRDLDTQRR